MSGVFDARDALAADRRRLVGQSTIAQRSATIALVIMTMVVMIGGLLIAALVRVQQNVSRLDIASENYASVIDQINYESSLMLDDRYRRKVTTEVLAASEAEFAVLSDEEDRLSTIIEETLVVLNEPTAVWTSLVSTGALREFEGNTPDPYLLEVAAQLPTRLQADQGAALTVDEARLANAIESREFVAPVVRRELIMQDIVAQSQAGFSRLVVAVMLATSAGVGLVWWVGLRPALLSVKGLTAGLNDHAAEIEHMLVQVSAAQRVARLGYWFSANNGEQIACSPEMVEILDLADEEIPTTLSGLAALMGADVGEERAEFLRLASGAGYRETNRTIMLPGRPTRIIRERIESLRSDSTDTGGLIGVLVDITQITNAQQVISRMEKFEIINLLVSGVAHDFNNQLAIVLGNAEIALDRADGAIETNLTSIVSACESASALIDQLRQTTMDPSVLAEEFNPADAVAGLVAAMGVPSDTIAVGLSVDPDAGSLVVTANRGLFETSVVNLLSNGFDAVDPVGGRVDVMVRCELGNDHDRPLAEGAEWLVRSGRRVAVSVSDNGVGMSEAVRQRALQPFFSTKKSSDQTNVGLGLWSVFSFVKTWNGEIRIESEEGRGTTVELLLPAVVPPDGRVDTDDDTDSAIRGTVLLVEDTTELADLLAEGLRRSGVEVVLCSNLAEARQELANRSSIELVVTDVWLGAQPLGFEVARIALEQYPHVGVVLVSGSIIIDDIPDDLRTPRCVLLAKPFSAARLRRTANETMRASRPSPLDPDR